MIRNINSIAQSCKKSNELESLLTALHQFESDTDLKHMGNSVGSKDQTQPGSVVTSGSMPSNEQPIPKRRAAKVRI
jgi:hypothetical protein